MATHVLWLTEPGNGVVLKKEGPSVMVKDWQLAFFAFGASFR
jgi:hypothetical protein